MPALLQSIGAKSSSGVTSIQLAFPNPVTAGSLKICMFGTPNTTATPSVSDNVDGNYSLDQTNGGGGNVLMVISSFAGATAGTTTVTASQTVSSLMSIIIEEWSGMVTSSAFDQGAKNSGTGTALSSCATPTTTQSNELILGAGGYTGTLISSAGAGFTPDILNPGGAARISSEYMIVSATGAQTATFTGASSAPWECLCATYKAAGLSPILMGGMSL
jgi:hypothetical protein